MAAIETSLKKLKPEDGDVVLIKTTVPARQLYDGIKRYLDRRGNPNILFILAPDESDIQTLSEEALKRYGWVKVGDEPGTITKEEEEE